MLVVGHRGASSRTPENTLEAFAAALADGADGVELDVRRTADGGLAIRHDERLADGRPVLELATAELPPEVPVLADVLEATAGARLVNIEIKNWPDDGDFDPSEHLAHAVVDLLRGRGALEDPRYLVSSFHLPTVDLVHELAPQLPTAMLVIDPGDPEAIAARAAERGHVALHPHHAFVTADLVGAAHAAGIALNTWTVDDADRIRWLASIGVDAVIVNDPAGALRALDR